MAGSSHVDCLLWLIIEDYHNPILVKRVSANMGWGGIFLYGSCCSILNPAFRIFLGLFLTRVEYLNFATCHSTGRGSVHRQVGLELDYINGIMMDDY